MPGARHFLLPPPPPQHASPLPLVVPHGLATAGQHLKFLPGRPGSSQHWTRALPPLGGQTFAGGGVVVVVGGTQTPLMHGVPAGAELPQVPQLLVVSLSVQTPLQQMSNPSLHVVTGLSETGTKSHGCHPPR